MSKAMKHVLELVEQTLEEAGISKDRDMFTVVVPLKDGSGVIVEKDINADNKANITVKIIGDLFLTEPVDTTFDDILGGNEDEKK